LIVKQKKEEMQTLQS